MNLASPTLAVAKRSLTGDSEAIATTTHLSHTIRQKIFVVKQALHLLKTIRSNFGYMPFGLQVFDLAPQLRFSET